MEYIFILLAIIFTFENIYIGKKINNIFNENIEYQSQKNYYYNISNNINDINNILTTSQINFFIRQI